jgi:Ca2+-transporting ATPase
LAAVGLSVILQVFVVYAPIFQRAFSTGFVTIADWRRCAVIASSVLWLREIQKTITRINTKG